MNGFGFRFLLGIVTPLPPLPPFPFNRFFSFCCVMRFVLAIHCTCDTPRRLSSAPFPPPSPPSHPVTYTLLHSPSSLALCCWLPTVLFIDLLPSSSSSSSPSPSFAVHNSFYVFRQPSLPSSSNADLLLPPLSMTVVLFYS